MPPPGSLTFGWEKKLRKTDEFSSVFRFKRVQRGACLDVLACPNDLGFPRLGLIVPKRILSLAVQRNRVKRVLREVFRLRQDVLGGLDVVIRLKATPWPADQPAVDLGRECGKLLETASRRRPSQARTEQE